MLGTSQMPPRIDEEAPVERIQMVAPASWIARVESWRRAQEKIPSRSEAIRVLVDKALASNGG